VAERCRLLALLVCAACPGDIPELSDRDAEPGTDAAGVDRDGGGPEVDAPPLVIEDLVIFVLDAGGAPIVGARVSSEGQDDRHADGNGGPGYRY